MDEQKLIFASNLTRILEQKDKKQAEVAEAIGISRAAMNMWCKGVTFPRMPKIQKLAKYLNVSVSDLVDPPKPGTDLIVKRGDSEFIIEMKSIEEGMDDESLDHLIAYARWFKANHKKGET